MRVRSLIGAQFGQWRDRCITDALQGQQGLRRHGPGVRMGIPFVEPAQCGNYQSTLGGGLFKVQRLPVAQCPLCLIARGAVAQKPQQRQGTIAVVGKVGVHPYPAVGTRIQTGECVPGVRYLPIQAVPANTLQCRVHHADIHALAFLSTDVTQLAGGQCGCGDAGLGGSAHGKRRGQYRVCALQGGARQGVWGQATQGPDVGEYCVGVHRASFDVNKPS